MQYTIQCRYYDIRHLFVVILTHVYISLQKIIDFKSIYTRGSKREAILTY